MNRKENGAFLKPCSDSSYLDNSHHFSHHQKRSHYNSEASLHPTHGYHNHNEYGNPSGLLPNEFSSIQGFRHNNNVNNNNMITQPIQWIYKDSGGNEEESIICSKGRTVGQGREYDPNFSSRLHSNSNINDVYFNIHD